MTDQKVDDDRPTSVVFDHCVKVYAEMAAQSLEEVISASEHPDDPANHMLVYEGQLTKLFGALALSTPYYTSVMNHLKSMGCVEQLRRGGGNSPSRWRLLREPDEDSFRSIEGMKRSRTGKTAALEQQVRDLNKRLHAAETELSNLKAMVNRLAELNNGISVQAARGEMAYKELRTHSHAVHTMPGEAPVVLEATK